MASFLQRLLWRSGLSRDVTTHGLSLSMPAPLFSAKQRWLVGAGHYEQEERKAIAATLDPALPTLEFGGGLGFVACLVNRHLADPSRHWVHEMDPRLIPVIEENKRRNGAAFTVVHAALGYEAAPRVTVSGTWNAGASLMDTGDEAVPSRTLRSALAGAGVGADTEYNLVLDVEGLEEELFEREWDEVRAAQAVMIELHPARIGPDGVDRITQRLHDAGFERVFEEGDVMGFRRPQRPQGPSIP